MDANRTISFPLRGVDLVCESGNVIYLGRCDSPISDLGFARKPPRSLNDSAPWQWSVLLGWFAGGWSAMVIILVWSQSAVRHDLLTDTAGAPHHQRRRATDQ